MKSAYLVLGIPGNASKEDIELAFANATAFYTASRLASASADVDKFLDLKNAYLILKDPDSRAAHDRKLNASNSVSSARARPAVTVYAEAESSWLTRPFPLIVLAAFLIFSIGYFVNQKRETTAKELIAKEQKIKQQAAEEVEKEAALRAKEESEKVQFARKNEQQERQFRQDSDRSFANARIAELQRGYQDMQRDAAAQQAEQRKRFEAASKEQSLAREGQQRLANDKARIRELCFQNYGRSNC